MSTREHEITRKINKHLDALRFELNTHGKTEEAWRLLNKLLFCHDTSERKEIEILTCAQADCALWFLLRKYRLTASIIGAVMRNKPYDRIKFRMHAAPTEKYLEEMRTNPYVLYGKNTEKLVVEEFLKKHQNMFTIMDTGLLILRRYPWFAVSPDGYGTYTHNGTHFTIEIKCPSVIHQGCKTSAETLLTKMNILNPLRKDNEEKKQVYAKPIDLGNPNEKVANDVVDKNHDYFIQCMFQMYAKKVDHCYFIVWEALSERTDKPSFMTVKFMYDSDLMREMLIKATQQYIDIFVDILFKSMIHE